MTETLQPILALLDEGLGLYRRNFVGFVLIAASWFVPVAIAAGLLTAAVSLAGATYGELIALLVVVAALLLFFQMLIYLIGGLSRAALAAAEGRPVRFRAAMAIHPLRAAGMGCFTIVYAFVAQLATSLLSMACVCPLYLAGFLLVALLGAATSDMSSAPLGLAMIGVFLIGLYASLMIAGATGSGLFYGLQPWAQEARPFGETLQRSLDLVVFRFWRNLLVWLLAALLVAAVGLTVTATVGTLLPLPLALALGEDSPAARAISVGAWLIGLVVILPPLPIWMALLYRRNRAAYEGEELAAKVQEWEHSGVRSQESEWRPDMRRFSLNHEDILNSDS